MYLKVKEMLILMFHRSNFSDAHFIAKIFAFFAISKEIAIQSVFTFCSLIDSRAKIQIL
jgi:hypothetical protein